MSSRLGRDARKAPRLRIRRSHEAGLDRGLEALGAAFCPVCLQTPKKGRKNRLSSEQLSQPSRAGRTRGRRRPLEMEDVGTGQSLQFLVPVPDGLATHAAVELQLLHALEELHHLLSELRLLPLAPIDALAQAVHLQRTELRTPKRGGGGGERR